LPLASKVIATAVLLAVLPLALPAIAVALVPVSVIRLPLEHVVGLLHCAAQFTVVLPVNADVQAPVLVLVCTARR
jgi:hypothetical protein